MSFEDYDNQRNEVVSEHYEVAETYSASVSYRMGDSVRKITVDYALLDEEAHRSFAEHVTQNEESLTTTDLYDLVQSISGLYTVGTDKKKKYLNGKEAIDYVINKNPHARRAVIASYFRNIRANMETQ